MKNLMRSLLLITILMAVSVVGRAALPMSSTVLAAEPTAEEIVMNATEAGANLRSYKYAVDMKMDMEATSGPIPMKFSTLLNGKGAIELLKKEMQMTMNMAMEGLPDSQKFETQAEMYIVGEWMYMRIEMPGIPRQWMKTKLTHEIWKKQQSQVGVPSDWLNTAVEITLEGSEDVEGIPSYIIKITPDLGAAFQWLSQQEGNPLKNQDLTAQDLTQMFKKLSVKQWIAKDSYLITKVDMVMTLEMADPSMGPSQKLMMNMKMAMTLTDHNQPVSINLPADAANAIEMPAP